MTRMDSDAEPSEVTVRVPADGMVVDKTIDPDTGEEIGTMIRFGDGSTLMHVVPPQAL